MTHSPAGRNLPLDWVGGSETMGGSPTSKHHPQRQCEQVLVCFQAPSMQFA